MSCGGGCGGTCAACSPRQHRSGSSPVCGTDFSGRLAPLATRLRTRFQQFSGFDPYQFSLVWTGWSGKERGEGNEVELARVQIVPNPQLVDLTAISFGLTAGGTLPQGTVRLKKVNPLLLAENLRGLSVPGKAYFDGCRMTQPGLFPGLNPSAIGLSAVQLAQMGGPPGVREHVEEPIEFFWEMVENGSLLGARSKFRVSSVPFKDKRTLEWVVVLERISEDRSPAGASRIGPDAEDD